MRRSRQDRAATRSAGRRGVAVWCSHHWDSAIQVRVTFVIEERPSDQQEAFGGEAVHRGGCSLRGAWRLDYAQEFEHLGAVAEL